MKKIILPLLILFVAFTCTGMLVSQQNKEDEKFQKAVDEYLEAYWKFYPTAATMAGFHQFDDKLEDLSERNLAKRQEELDEFNQKFVADIDKGLLSADFQIDHELIIDGLDLDLMLNEQLLPWEYNPLFYNNILKYTIKALINRFLLPKLVAQLMDRCAVATSWAGSFTTTIATPHRGKTGFYQVF